MQPARTAPPLFLPTSTSSQREGGKEGERASVKVGFREEIVI